MNKEIVKNQAETIARAFEAQTSHKMKHSVALEIVSALYGKKNYNVMADYLKSAVTELSEMEREHARNNTDTDYGDECVITTLNGRKIKTAAHPQECDYIRITDRADNEIAYWSCDEWRDCPEEVMGAIVGALKGGESRELPQFAQQKAKSVVPQCLKKPLNFEQIKEIMAQGGQLSAVISIAMYDFMQGIEYINDLAQELITGNEYFELEDGDSCVDVQAMLEDLSYTPMGVDGDNILVEVNAQIVYY